MQPVDIIMRSYNDAAVIGDTLEMVMRQRGVPFTLWNFDSSSSDGTLEIIRRYNKPERIFTNDPKTYNPGRVLNEAMEKTHAEIAVFLNSDATPNSEDWLKNLIAPFADPNIAATFGRQTARPDCRTLFVKDTERAFGDGSVSAGWVHFFSMANSAIRRSVWNKYRFETRIQYSEDIEWSYRVRKAGFKIAYVPEAAATHSHNYSLRQSYKRHFGEGKAEAWIFRQGEINTAFWRYMLLPFAMEVARDIVWSLRHGSLDGLMHSIPLRFTQKWARWRGMRAGIKEYGAG